MKQPSKGISACISALHPNMYDHLVESNLLSKQQWQGIKDCVEKYGFWDTRPSIMESFSDSDIIISDTSSMLIYAFLSGKPTIYTQGDDMAEICAWALRVAQGVFIAKASKNYYKSCAIYALIYSKPLCQRSSRAIGFCSRISTSPKVGLVPLYEIVSLAI